MVQDNDSDSTFTADHNAYINTTNLIFGVTNASDVVLTNFIYAVGTFGNYYQVSTNLIDRGSRSASDAGLFNYTIQTNQIPDKCTVDIGLHYRLDGGNPTVNTNSTAQQLAQLLVPPGVTVANATNTGAVVARGTFTNGIAAGLPIDYGVILSSGNITNAIGPNNDSGRYLDSASDMMTTSDTNLDDIVGGGLTYDAAVLEFDIISTNSFTLQFQYIFASEEYPEFIATSGGFNDPVAIFVSTNYDGMSWIINTNDNIALVPGTNQYVAVNTINGGYPPRSVPPSNPQYYVDNADPQHTTGSTPIFNIQYDGTTVLLTAQIQVSANVTNHIKIAVEDYGDPYLDSAVFIKAASSCP